MTCRQILALSAMLLVVVPAPDAQTRVGETIEVSIASVDVVVTDKTGNRIRGLSARDFEILEDGKPQPITNFAEYSSDAVAAGEPASDASSKRKRTIAMFVDAAALPRGTAGPLFENVSRMLDQTLRPGDAVMIATWDGTLRVLQELTTDRAAIDHTIGILSAEAGPRDSADAAIAEYQHASRAAGKAQAEGADGRAAKVPLEALEAATRAYVEMQRKTQALGAILDTLAGAQEQKVLILVSHRFSRIAGQEFLVAPRSGGGARRDVEAQFDTTDMLRAVIRSANANGVAIYTMFPRGLERYTEVAETARMSQQVEASGIRDHLIFGNETDPLQMVARETGGASSAGLKEAIELLPRIGEDLDNYYSLGYRMRTRASDRPRVIEVKARNRDAVVRARREMVVKSDAARMKDITVAALFHPLGATAISLVADLGALRQEKKGRKVLPVNIRVPIAALTLLPGKESAAGSFTAYLAAATPAGAVSDVTESKQPFSIPSADLERARSGYMTFAAEMVIDASADRVVVTVVDDASREFGIVRANIPRAETVPPAP